MKNITDIVKAIPNFTEPVVTDPKEIIKGEYHEKDGNWFHSTGRFAGYTAEEVIKKYRLSEKKILPYVYYAVTKDQHEKLVDENVLLETYGSVYIVGLYLGGMTEKELENAIG